jgi:hypothetical protein
MGAATVLVYGADLYGFAQVEALLVPHGYEVRRVRDGQALAGDVAVVDVERVDPVEAAALLRPARLLGFGSHEAPEALRAARAAGFDRAVARSAVAERLPQLVADLLERPVEGTL